MDDPLEGCIDVVHCAIPKFGGCPIAAGLDWTRQGVWTIILVLDSLCSQAEKISGQEAPIHCRCLQGWFAAVADERPGLACTFWKVSDPSRSWQLIGPVTGALKFCGGPPKFDLACADYFFLGIQKVA